MFLYDANSATTTLISTNTSGDPANHHATDPSINADGSLIAYASGSSDVVIGDTNVAFDVFLYDADNPTATLLTTDTIGNPTDGGSWKPSISADGSKIAYRSDASDIVLGDTNGVSDVFLWSANRAPMWSRLYSPWQKTPPADSSEGSRPLTQILWSSRSRPGTEPVSSPSIRLLVRSRW